MPDDAAQVVDRDEWVERVLGVSVARPPAADAARLGHRLQELAARVLTADLPAEMAGALKALAREATLALKDGRVADASDRIEALATALARAGGKSSTAGTQAPTLPRVDLTGAGALWAGTRDTVAGALDQVLAAILDYFAEEQMEAELRTAFERKVAPLRTILDGTLGAELDRADKAVDGTDQEPLLATIRATLGHYRALLAADADLPRIDAIPFASATPVASLSDALSNLEAIVA